jgi:outer membrane lipoprotein-sorting protein
MPHHPAVGLRLVAEHGKRVFWRMCEKQYNRGEMRFCHVAQCCTLITTLLVLAACGGAPLPDAGGQIAQAQRAWDGDWHAVWQIEWANAPVRGPLVAEVWHAADGRLRIETLEAPTAALNGLTLVDDGRQAWLHDLRSNLVERDTRERLRIPLASDMLAAMDWLLAQTDQATVIGVNHDELESGPATRLDLTTSAGDRATLWVHAKTGLPAGFALHSEPWGEVKCVTRSIDPPGQLDPALFRNGKETP